LLAGFTVFALLVTSKFVISARVMLLYVWLTDVTKIAMATDHVHPSQKPETWNIGPLMRVAVVLGVLTLVEALGLLAISIRRNASTHGVHVTGGAWFALCSAGRLRPSSISYNTSKTSSAR
jgi:hypothetical protein